MSATALSVQVLSDLLPAVDTNVIMPILTILTRNDRSTIVSLLTTGNDLGISSSAAFPESGQ